MARKRSVKKEVTVEDIRELLIKEIKSRGYNVKTFSESELGKQILGDRVSNLRTYLAKNSKSKSSEVFSLLLKAFTNKSLQVKTEIVKTVKYYMEE